MKEIKISKSDLPTEYIHLLTECEKNNECYFDSFFTTTENIEIDDSTYTFVKWVDRHEFKIGEKYFYFEWNSNRETPPFLLHDNKLIYRISNFDLDYDDPKRTEYAMINLTDKLKK